MYRQKNKKELLEILRQNNHPHSDNLEKFTKKQLLEFLEKSCLIPLPPITLPNTIANEKKEEIIEHIGVILNPTEKK